jgi:glycosyltransferase involved in cell wall biosynthesis
MTSDQPVLVSVLIPCLNEEKYIGELLKNILSQDYPQDQLEVFVIDGNSADRTSEIAAGFCREHPFIHLLKNPHNYVSYALNMGILASKGEVIVRMDAHSLYPQNYISRLVNALLGSDADNTGGMWITEPGNSSRQARAIALATSHPFGIGNASYRLGSSVPKFVDTVPYGCYRRNVFDRIGNFDEQLIRNQDDEFNARLIKSGAKILLLPDVKIRYFARENIAKMSSMFYQYGLYKPLVNLKLGKPASIRQLFPPGLVISLLLTLIFSVIWLKFLALFLFILLLYLFGVIYFSIQLGKKEKLVDELLSIFPAIHFSYGWGYLRGLIRFVVLRKHKKMAES